MIRIFIIGNDVINVDSDDDAIMLLKQGAKELTTEDITAAGIIGYEHLVSPLNTKINEDGSITFSLLESNYYKLENVIKRKLQELEIKFQEAEEIGVISSSLGFSFTANNRALRDVESLIKEMEYTGKESDYIVAADNNMYELSVSQLKTLFVELTQYGKQLYNTKWALRSKISKATSKEEIDAVQVTFVTNYTPTSVILKN